MGIYKNSYDLEKIKEDIVNDVINEITDTINTEIEKKIMKDLLINKIRKSNIITSLDEETVEVSSEDINRLSSELYIDILTTFCSVNTTNEEINKYSVAQKIHLNNLKTKIKQLSDRLLACKESLSNNDIPKYHIEKFRDASVFDKSNRIYQRDRYGQYFPKECYINYKENSITLPYLMRDNSLKYDNVVETAYANKRFQLGNGFINLNEKNKSSDINNILNADDTYWSDTILSDAPFEVSFSNKQQYTYVSDNYFYDINEGAVCELEIRFETINTINEISLNVCSKYPIDIIAIRYKLTDDEDEALYEIVYPDNDNKNLSSVFTKDTVTYRFPEILCKNIYILFVQKHYTRNIYLYDPTSVYKDALWYSNSQDNDRKNSQAVFKPNYFDKQINNYSWQNVNKEVVESSEDLVNILIGSKEKLRKVIKYEYSYGFYNIGCYNNHYNRVGFYVSKPLEIGNNIKKISISTTEIHQLDSIGNRVTDIEYYITSPNSTNISEWIPILPTNKSVIECEMLFITGETRAYLRFETNNVIAIMKNGVALPESSAEYHLDINERTGNIWSVLIFNYDYDAVYSIKYVPIDGSNIIDMSNKAVTSIESKEAKGTNYVILDSTPIIDATESFCNVTVVQKGTDGLDMIVEATNVTNVQYPSRSYENFDTTSSHYQFYVLNNTIYFNKKINTGSIIDVTYRHLMSSIITKAILRRNSTKDGWLTPELIDIKYQIETL